MIGTAMPPSANPAEVRLIAVARRRSNQWTAAKVTVTATETPPQMFREGIGVVVEGSFQPNQVFKTNRLMVNHSNEYKAPHDGGMPGDWKDTVTQAANEQ